MAVLSGRGTAAAFRRGLLAGVLAVVATVVFINKTPVADWIVAPLLVPDSDGPVEAVVVLGAGVLQECAPNQHSVRRVLLAARQWRQHPEALVLFSGGTGGACPVSEAMAGLAREVGLPADRIRTETASLNTHENAVASAALLRALGISRMMLVTDRLHMRRAIGAFERQGQTPQRASVPIYEGHEDNLSMLQAGLREFVALAYYSLRGWTGPADPAPSPVKGTTMPDRPPTPGAGPIVLLGASYAESWPLDEVAGVPVINKGIAGQQSFELLARFDQDVVAAAPRAVILWGFINDIFRTTPDMDATTTRIKASFTEMIGRARAHGIIPILATEVTARPPARSVMDTVAGWVGTLRGKRAYQDQINEHVMAVNAWLVDTATREGLLVLHLQQVVAEAGGRRQPRFAQPDGSHITAAGYDALTSYARPVLEEYLGVR